MPLLCLFAAAHAALPQTVQSQSAAPFVVVLDPAHGGTDLGARLADGTTEKDANLALAQRLRVLLEERGFTVITTRPSLATAQPGPELSADQRAAIANHAHAQACLILHATATGNGLHLFTSSISPQPDSAATRTFIPWQTAQAASVTRSIELAAQLNAAFAHTGIPITVGRTYLPPMDSMTCPVVAVEVAPLTQKNSHDHKDADDAAYSQRVAETLAWSLEQWRSRITGNATLDDSLNPEHNNSSGPIRIQQQPAAGGKN